MQAPSESPTVRVLRWLARAVCRHPRWFVWPQLLLCVGSVAYTVQALRFDTSRNDLVGADTIGEGFVTQDQSVSQRHWCHSPDVLGGEVGPTCSQGESLAA